MKKMKRFLLGMLGLIVLLLQPSISVLAQNPGYQCKIANAVQVSCNVYEFDVTLNSTQPTNLMKLVNFQVGILVNPAIIPPGGEINIALVPGSSTIPNVNQRPGPEKFLYNSTTNCIQVAPVVPPGSANASTITMTGYTLFRLRVACTLPFVAGTNPNHTWNFVFPPVYPTKVFAYIGTTNTDVTNPSSHILVAPANPVFVGGFPDPIAQTVNGGGSICNIPGAPGVAIGLDGSQAGYSYYLHLNGTPLANTFVLGTGAAVNFPLQSSPGIYTVTSTSCTGSVNMIGQAVVDVITPVTSTISISANPGTAVVPGTQVTYTASSTNGGTAPFYQWYVNGVPDYINGLGVTTYIYTPLNGDTIYCEMYPDADVCTTDPMVTSNLIVMWVGTCTDFTEITNAEICSGDVYSWRGSDYSISGTYTDSLISILPPGCDSVYVLNLTVYPAYEFVTSAAICDGDVYVWRGNNYTVNGTYYDSLQTVVGGCDSTYVLNLNVHPVYNFVTDAGICDGDIYSWRGNDYSLPGTYYDSLQTQQGCDSIYRLNLEVYQVFIDITNADICEGDIFTWRNNDYSIEGTYYDSLISQFGCDSIFVLNLNVNPLPVVSVSGLGNFYCEYYDAVTMLGTPAGGTFTGNGVTGNVFDPAAAGLGTWDIVYTYTDPNGCSNSDTVSVVIDECLSIGNHENGDIIIYPNPVIDMLNVEIFAVEASQHIWSIYDANGKLIISGTHSLVAGKNFLNIETTQLSKGLYMLRSNINGLIQSARIVKQ